MAGDWHRIANGATIMIATRPDLVTPCTLRKGRLPKAMLCKAVGFISS